MKPIAIIFCLFFGIGLSAQLDPVKWEFTWDCDTGKLHARAEIEEGWYMYSQHTAEGGPIPLTFEFDNPDEYTLVGEFEELSESIEEMDPLFELMVVKYKDEALFEQKIKDFEKDSVIKVSVTYMVCDNEKCLPPVTVPFEVKT